MKPGESPPSTSVALLGDLVDSRSLPDREAAQRDLEASLHAVNRRVGALDPLHPTVGDEFQGIYDSLGKAIEATRGAWVATLDSDGQFDLADALPMLARCRAEGIDFVTGYRRAKRDGVVRVLADRGLNLLVRGMFGLDLRDTNCALKVIRGDLARSLRIEARGYPTPTEVTVKLLELGARAAEMPVEHGERVAGSSKLKVLSTSADMARFLLYLRGKVRLYRAGVIQAL
jgi:dolichol-phosphate mannosyltransferase